MSNVLELNDVHLKRGGKTVLRDVSLHVAAGEVLALLGPNGAGKSSLLQVALGLQRPERGSARLFGQAPQSRAARQACGTMLQLGGVPANLTVAEHIRLFRSYYQRSLSSAEVLERSGLTNLANRRSDQLSGGEHQRLMFALAICGRPELLILDEPTVGLDVSTRREFWKQVREFAQTGCAILLTTHYLEEAEHLSERIEILHQGSVLTGGSPAEIKARFPQSMVRLQSGLSLASASDLEAVVDADELDDGRLELVSRDAGATIRALVAAGDPLQHLTVSDVNLEDAFVHITDQSDKELSA